jgi:hypothetical protein
MAELDDEDDWTESDKPFEKDWDSNSVVAESNFYCLAYAMGGKAFMLIVMAVVQPMLGSADYKQRYAGLVAVAAIGSSNGCQKQMEPTLPQIVAQILGFLNDPVSH